MTWCELCPLCDNVISLIKALHWLLLPKYVLNWHWCSNYTTHIYNIHFERSHVQCQLNSMTLYISATPTKLTANIPRSGNERHWASTVPLEQTFQNPCLLYSWVAAIHWGPFMLKAPQLDTLHWLVHSNPDGPKCKQTLLKTAHVKTAEHLWKYLDFFWCIFPLTTTFVLSVFWLHCQRFFETQMIYLAH